MKIKKVKKFKFDLSNLKFAVLVLLSAFLYDSTNNIIGYSDFRGSNLKKNGICLAVGVVSASANITYLNGTLSEQVGVDPKISATSNSL
jgi:hypothetical protein